MMKGFQNYGFTLGTKTAKELGIVMLSSSKRPILPQTVDRILTIPGRCGAYDFGAELGPRLFELECALIANTQAELQQACRNLAAHLMDETGRPRLHQLRFDVEPDKYYNVRYAGSLPVERIASLGRFTLPLIAYDPFAYGDEQQATFFNDSITVTNAGTTETYPRFSVTFTAAASEWKVTLGMKFVRVVRGFAAGDTLDVNCATGAIAVNGTPNISYLDWMNSEFFSLLPGDNTLTVTPSGVCDTTIIWNPRWL